MIAIIGIPVFASISQRTEGPTEDILVAFGAHFTPRVALLRSLTEMNQFLPSVATQDTQGNTQYLFPEQEAINWWKTSKLQENTYLASKQNVPAKKLSDFTDHSTNDLKADVEKCIEIARNHALEVFVLDQTRSDIGLNVVKVIVPGLRHWEFHDLLFHSRTRLGRHNQGYGGTMRFIERFDPLPALKPPMSDKIVPLEKPNLTAIIASDPPFTSVLEPILPLVLATLYLPHVAVMDF